MIINIIAGLTAASMGVIVGWVVICLFGKVVLWVCKVVGK